MTATLEVFKKMEKKSEDLKDDLIPIGNTEFDTDTNVSRIESEEREHVQ